MEFTEAGYAICVLSMHSSSAPFWWSHLVHADWVFIPDAEELPQAGFWRFLDVIGLKRPELPTKLPEYLGWDRVAWTYLRQQRKLTVCDQYWFYRRKIVS
ncbi:MAG: hypothetical protein WC802_05275 [Patescibacteria group bacterium]|jgi:hypothetical protein